VSNYIDYVFTVVFFVECVIKVISMGLILDNGSYLRDYWNILDFFIVVSSVIDVGLTTIEIPFIKVLRLLRTLRPLRFITHNDGLKMIVIALIESVGPIANVLIVVVLVWLIFAILGVNFWAGKMFSCSIEPYLYNTEEHCVHMGGVWERYI